MPNKKQNHKNPKRKIDKCCEKCYTTYTNDDYPIRKTTDACLNPNCECHKSQPSKREIEKEKVSCKDCRFEKDGYCESFDDEIAVMSIAIMNFDIECTNFEPKSQPPTDWEKDFDTYNCDGEFHSAWFIKSEWLVINQEKIIKYIRKLLAEQRAETIREFDAKYNREIEVRLNKAKQETIKEIIDLIDTRFRGDNDSTVEYILKELLRLLK